MGNDVVSLLMLYVLPQPVLSAFSRYAVQIAGAYRIIVTARRSEQDLSSSE